MTLKDGDLLNDGRYRIVASVGSGGFGTVYRAIDTRLWSDDLPTDLATYLAIKISSPRLPPARHATEQERQRQMLEQTRAQFKREATLLHGLKHHNLPRVTDYFEEPGLGQCMVMEFIEGLSLVDLLEQRGGPLPEAEALYYTRQVAGALTYLHTLRQPIFHRDVKPSNVILAAGNVAFLVDFGVAKVHVDTTQVSQMWRATSSGYSPPEMYDQSLPTTARSDVYSLGATLYTLLTYTGRLEDELSPPSTRSARPEATRPPRAANPGVSEQTSRAVMQALNLPEVERPASVAHFMALLPQLPYTPPAAAPPPPRPRPAPAANDPEHTVVHDDATVPPARPPDRPAPPASTLPVVGETWLGHLQVRRALPSGLRDATVFLARDETLGRDVEIWLWRGRGPTTGPAHKTLAGYQLLNHESLAGVLDHGNAAGHAWLAVPHLPFDASQLGRLSAGDASKVVDRLAAALDYLHRRGVVHGSVRPKYVRFDGAARAYLALLEPARFVAGTLRENVMIEADEINYRPEWDKGPQPSAAADIYALGGVLFHMLTRQLPAEFAAGGRALPPPIADVIERGLSSSPYVRYATAGALAADLRAALAEPPPPAPPPPQPARPPTAPTPAGPSRTAAPRQTESASGYIPDFGMAPRPPAPRPAPTRKTRKDKNRATGYVPGSMLDDLPPRPAPPRKWGALLFWIGAALLLGLGLWFLYGWLAGDGERTATSPRSTAAAAEIAVAAGSTATATRRPTATVPPTFTPLPTLALPIVAGTALPPMRASLGVGNADLIEPVARWGRGAINDVAYAPDGRTLAVAAANGVHLYLSATLSETETTASTLLPLDAPAQSVAFAPDGETLAAGAWDGSIRLWRVADGEPLATLTGHENRVTSVAFAPDGETLASGSWDDTIRLWRVADGEQLRVLEDPSNSVLSVAFAPDGRTLASGADDAAVRLWEVSTGTLLRTLTGHTDAVWSVAFSPDGRTLASGAADNTIRLWRPDDGTTTATLPGHDDFVLALAFSPDGETLASGSEDHTVRLWDVAGRQPLWTATGHNFWASSVAFAPDGLNVLSGGGDGSLRLWRASDGAETANRQEFNSLSYGVLFSPDGNTLLSLAYDDRAWLWPLGGGAPLALGHEDWVYEAAFSPDGATLATAGGDGGARLWNASGGEALTTLGGPDDFVLDVAFSPDGERIAFTTNVGDVYLGRADGGSPPSLLAGHIDLVWDVAFSPDGAVLATGSDDGTARLWRVSDGASLATLRGHTDWVRDLAFSPDGAVLATGSEDGAARLWRVSDGALLAPLAEHTGPIYDIAFSPDGLTLATGSDDGTARLWQVSDGALLATLEGHSGAIYDLAYSSGGLLATAGEDETIRLWDATGEEVARLVDQTGRVWDIAFSPDDRLLASASDDGRVRLWGIPVEGGP